MYGCGHFKHRDIYDCELGFQEDKKEYIKWKYSLGFRGTKEMCWDCYRKRGGVL